MTRYDVIIIGGGITGLTAAYRLKKDAPQLKVALLEATHQLGGKLETERFGDFVIETGADSFLSRKPRGIALCEELGIENQLVGRKPTKTRAYVRRHGKLHPLPEGLTGLVPTDLTAFEKTELLTAAGKARLAQEGEIPQLNSQEDESVASFIQRRMGVETYENLVEPLMSGIYAGDGEQMSILSTFPQLRQVEAKHGSLLGGLTGASAGSQAKYPPFVSFAGGIADLIEALVEHLDGIDIYLDTRVDRLAQTADSGWQVTTSAETFACQQLILTTPAHTNANLLAPVDQELAAAMDAIPYAGTVLVNIGVPKEAVTLPDGYGYVIPRAEMRNLLACTWSSQKWDNRSPDNFHLLRVYIGRYGEDDVCSWSDGKLIDLARQELKQTLGLDPAAKQMYLVARWPKGLPQYTLGHPERLQAIDTGCARLPGLHVAGASYRGVGIPDCIRSAETVTQNLLTHV